MLQTRGPYDYERLRHRLGEYPRPSQPNTSQPNQRMRYSGWGQNTREYWGEVFQNYMKRRKSSPLTNLELGRM